jgi:hypothetical protein
LLDESSLFKYDARSIACKRYSARSIPAAVAIANQNQVDMGVLRVEGVDSVAHGHSRDRESGRAAEVEEQLTGLSQMNALSGLSSGFRS